MKTFLFLPAMLLTMVTSKASLYTTGVIPEGSPVGATFTGTYDQAAAGFTVSSLTVNLTVSGGYNGGLYSYLVAPNGTLVMLLNQPGITGGNPFGYAGSGLSVTLSDAAAGSIQTTPETPGSVFSGTCQAAGSLSGFGGSVADGTWTLFFADQSAGGGQATLTGWSLDITAVPEPVNVALVVFGVAFVAAGAVRSYLNSRKATQAT